jgi:hypothetical protein
MADPWVRPTSPGPPDPGVPFRPEDDARPATGKPHSPDDYLLIDRLREDAAAGRMDLDSILSEATHAARYFTDSTGAALALWRPGALRRNRAAPGREARRRLWYLGRMSSHRALQALQRHAHGPAR